MKNIHRRELKEIYLIQRIKERKCADRGNRCYGVFETTSGIKIKYGDVNDLIDKILLEVPDDDLRENLESISHIEKYVLECLRDFFADETPWHYDVEEWWESYLHYAELKDAEDKVQELKKKGWEARVTKINLIMGK